jgi:hypothetical protein
MMGKNGILTMKKSKKSLPKGKRTATITLYTTHAVSHLGLKREEGNPIPFPGLSLVSVRIQQLCKVARQPGGGYTSSQATELLTAFDTLLDSALDYLSTHQKTAAQLLAADAQVAHSHLFKPQTYTIACSSPLAWKTVRALLTYDKIITHYLTLYTTAAMDKKAFFQRTKQHSTFIRKLFSAFNADAKKIIPSTPVTESVS